MIPKIIHQIWIGPNPEPSIWIDTFRKDYISKFPDYQYHLWNEEKVLSLLEKYPLVHKIYNVEPTWNGKSDILRYIILYEYGGIYIDADSVWVNNRSLDDLINNCDTGLFAAKGTNESHITGGVIGSVPHHNLFIKLLTHIENYAKYKGTFSPKRYVRLRQIHGVCRLIGPILFDQYFVQEKHTEYPSVYFYPIIWHGIKKIDLHTKIKLPSESYMFQYGYSTNNLKDAIAVENK